MYKVHTKHKNAIIQEFKTFLPLVSALVAKGKSSSEEDARILLNDILHQVLGYNKYNELKTEMRDRNGRIDYAVKLTDGPNKTKPDKYDFVIEAKAVNVELNQSVIDQTLSYCLTMGLDYFMLTNAYRWQLYKITKQGKTPIAVKIHEVVLSMTADVSELAEEFYLFSRASYLNSDWKEVAEVVQATKTEDVVAVLLSDKVVKLVARELSAEHEVRVGEETVRDIIEKKVLSHFNGEYNKKLLKKLNEKPAKKESPNTPELQVQNTRVNEIVESTVVLDDVEKNIA